MADLEGGLLEYRPGTLLAFLAATHKTGMLRVAGHHHTVTVWLAEGIAVASDSTTSEGDLLDQLVDVLRMPNGAFRFVEGALPRPEDAAEPHPDLLPRAVERLAKWEDLADAVPSLKLHVKLLNSGDQHVTLSSAAWSVSVAVSAGHASVEAAAKHLKWSAYDTCVAVRELVEAGRAELVPPPKRRRRGSKVDAPAVMAGVWHPANQPLWPGTGTTDRDRFSDVWAYDE